MSINLCLRRVAIALAFFASAAMSLASAQDLVEAEPDSVFYELSNLRSERGITGDVIAFDYKRTRDGTGSPQLAARTDTGPMHIMGFGTRIDATGTIRLEDRFARIRSTLNRGQGEFGIEFFFTVQSKFDPSGARFLVSNSVTHGTMNTRVQARPPNAAELARREHERKSKVPPETVPAGYVRSDAATVLVPGMPVMIGVAGEWMAGRVVSLPNATSVKVLRDGTELITSLRRDGWLAVSNETLQQVRKNPKQFSIDLRTLPQGNLILPDDVEALATAVPTGTLSLAKGTPLLMEKYLKWEDVYFLSSDNVNARVLTTDVRRP